MTNNDAAQIIADTNDAISQLNTLEGGLTDEIQKFQQTAFDAGRVLSPAERVRIDSLNDAIQSVLDAREKLAIDSIDALENSAMVARLKSNMDAVNSGLKNALGRLDQAVKITHGVAQILALIVKIAAKVATL